MSDNEVVLKGLPKEVYNRLLELTNEIHKYGVYGGELTSEAIDNLKEYQEKLKTIK